MSVVNEINLQVNETLEHSDLNDKIYRDSDMALFIIWGVILPLIASAGLVGNILTIIVLWRREMHSTTILYLRGLVITDTGILIGSVITLTPISCANYLHAEALEYFRDNVYPVIHSPGYYIIMTLQQCNVWITVSVSIERYIAICHPFRAARLITRRKTIIVLICIVINSLIYNVPHLLASTASPCIEAFTTTPPLETKVTVLNSEGDLYGLHVSSTQSTLVSVAMFLPTSAPPSNCLKVTITEFGKTGFYTTYRTIMYCIIIYVIPFLALLILNSFLIKELMTMQQRRSGTNIHDENEANLSLVLVLIVIVFIFCQTPGLISQFDLIHDEAFIYWLAVSNLLFTTNSAVNFLIYTAFGRKFRRVLLRVFRHIFRKHRRQSQSSCRTTQYTNGDIETFEPPATRCTLLCLISCSGKESNANGDVGENIPLNTVRDTNSTALNGVVRNMKYNNGTKRILYATVDEDSEREAAVSCGTAETMSLCRQDNHEGKSYTDSDKFKSLETDTGVHNCGEDNRVKTSSSLSVEQTAITNRSDENASDEMLQSFHPVVYSEECCTYSNDNSSGKDIC